MEAKITFDELINNGLCDYNKLTDYAVDTKNYELLNEILKRTKTTKYLINRACMKGDIGTINWIKNSEHAFNYDDETLNFICMGGSVEILDWFYDSSYEMKMEEEAFCLASK